jgi:hypothetical protein
VFRPNGGPLGFRISSGDEIRKQIISNDQANAQTVVGTVSSARPENEDHYKNPKPTGADDATYKEMNKTPHKAFGFGYRFSKILLITVVITLLLFVFGEVSWNNVDCFF